MPGTDACSRSVPPIARRQPATPFPATIRAADILDILVSRLREGTVVTDAEILRERAIDAWALPLLRRGRGDEVPAPAAAVFPASTETVAAMLAWPQKPERP